MTLIIVCNYRTKKISGCKGDCKKRNKITKVIKEKHRKGDWNNKFTKVIGKYRKGD